MSFSQEGVYFSRCPVGTRVSAGWLQSSDVVHVNSSQHYWRHLVIRIKKGKECDHVKGSAMGSRVVLAHSSRSS